MARSKTRNCAGVNTAGGICDDTLEGSFSALLQFVAAGLLSGLDLVTDKQLIAPSWNAKIELDVLTPIFKLNGIRIMEAHSLSGGLSTELTEGFAAFGIDPQQYVQGWGLALDSIYDKTIGSLKAINALLQSAMGNHV
jgi:hypothetical protein